MSTCQKNALFYPTERIPTKYYILSILYIYFTFFSYSRKKS